MSDIQPPTNAYQKIIDQLVGETRLGSVYAKRVSDNMLFPVESENSTFNELLSSLSERQRQLLSQLLQDERTSSIHDVLAMLSWWVDCHGVGLTLNGQTIPVDYSGMGLHGDYIGRCEDWAWPASKA